MKATVIFQVGEAEIKTIGKGPVTETIPYEGRKHMAVLNAISRIKKDIGVDLTAMDEDISDKATVIMLDENTSTAD